MTSADDILRLRLRRQLVAADVPAAPDEVVRRLLAMQAQDYLGALWSVGLRCRPEVVNADVERAISERRIVRTWLMRGTLHFAAPEDVRWLLGLVGARVFASAKTRHTQLGQDEATFDRAAELFSDALSGGRILTRAEAMALLEADGLETSRQRGYHVLWSLALRGLICCGPMSEGQQTFVLLDEWVPPGKPEQDAPPHEEALARLVTRYLEAHGPASLEDLAWWSGLTKTDVRAGIDAADSSLQRIEIGDVTYMAPAGPLDRLPQPDPAAPEVFLLPGFDEYMLGYTSRDEQLGEHSGRYASTIAANGMFTSTLTIDGFVVGTWKRTLGKRRVEITANTFRALTRAEHAAMESAAEAYGRFVGLEAAVTVTRADR
jgi:hypothetical protein